MSALPPNFPDRNGPGMSMPGSGRGAFSGAAASATSMRWAALQDAAAVVATLAGLEPERSSPEIRNFPALIRHAGEWRRETAEKGIGWMRLIAEGTAGHGSMIHPDNAVTELAAAVARLGRHEFPVRLTKTVRAFLEELCDALGVEFRPDDIERTLRELGPASRMIGATLRNTLNPSVLEAGYKTNVIPQTAVAEVDGRFLPGYEEEFFATVWPLTQGHRLRKRRYRVPGATGVWEVDEFLDRELILAEIELEAEDQPVEIPPEIAAVMDREVTDEPAFSNYKLSR